MLPKGTYNKLEITRHSAFQHVTKEHHIWHASLMRADIFGRCFGFFLLLMIAFSSLPSCIDLPGS